MLMACKACGWVHFSVTRQAAEAEVARFNASYDAASPDVQACYGGRASIANYMRCFRCGESYRQFRPADDGECPRGSTVQPILVEDE